ncbi:MAG: hypothetical protein HY912_06915 [Desulfomonile tiedjei]|uniref:PilZ domain-containing protein n=1 Tax=Desulfomonile tiedjei TaxID=2358 RepID=A0A9D6YZT5_9BACT|nr:hypothetical protein [Desulfomonile tiedjei]
MSEKTGTRMPATMAEIQLPFRFIVVHGSDPSRRSAEQKAVTKSINLQGLIFETPAMAVDDYHLSFTESTYGRNALEISLDLGKKYGTIELVAQVDWYERRSTALGHCFSVGVSFIDLPSDIMGILRDYLQVQRSLGQ